MHRRIVHVDMDAFYASVEQRDRPEYRGLPLVVGGDSRRGVVAAASYEARKFGIRSAMPIGRALQMCPTLVRVEPRFSVYRQVSQQIHEIFHSYTELLEPLALDESFLDLTAYCREHACKAGAVALEIKRRIRETTSLTASAGVGPNKLVAKIASGFQKPDGLTIVAPDRVEEFMAALPIGELWGVGPVTERRFRDLGIQTVGQLAQAELELLVSHFGRWAEHWRQLAQGVDHRPVEHSQEAKSISAEETFETNVSDQEAMLHVLGEQAQVVARRLASARREATTVVIKLRYADFTTITRSHTVSGAVREPHQILYEARRLLEQQTDLPPLRLIGLGVSGLVSLDRNRQLELDFSRE